MSCTVAVPLRQLAKISYWHWGHLQCNVDFTLIFICLSFKGNANWILISSGNGWWNIYTPASSTSACGVATHQARGENQCVEIGAGADKQPWPRRNADFTISQWRQKPGVSGCKWVFIQCKRGISPCSPSSPPPPHLSLCGCDCTRVLEQSPTSCIWSCNRDYKNSALPRPHCQIIVPAQLVCMPNPVLLSQ